MVPIDFQLATSAADWQRIVAVRAIVFIEEQSCPYDEEFDEFDAASLSRDAVLHVLGTAQHTGPDARQWSEPVACARIRLMAPVAKLERLAIRPAWRGGGNGHRLLSFLMQTAREQGYQQFKLNAQKHLAGFYQQHGFVVSGAGFVEAGIDHLPMIWEPTKTRSQAGNAE